MEKCSLLPIEPHPSTSPVRSPFFLNPLPGPPGKWIASSLGLVHNWPSSLKKFTNIISILPHPAAIYWGEDLTLLYNESWLAAGGVGMQGSPQQHTLPSAAVAALQASYNGAAPVVVSARDLLRSSPDDQRSYTVLLSPLLDPESGLVLGVLSQLMLDPKFDDWKDGQSPARRSDSHLYGPLNINTKKEMVHNSFADNIPLDKHPFFHRFAEMLPTGLAILNHKAEAVFVNQYFHELTTHQGDDVSFQGWPQSIHPDDYDRVINAYDEAFKSQTQLRIEFRASGQENPWRLLLLTPLGDGNVEHMSLREHGVFICSIVDITSEKVAELAQRRAAVEAQERKEQQERFIDMISHEIRNPLSAVLHCSEDIIEEVTRTEKRINLISIVEAAETIILCVTHQKNIVDDVLSFSKLDASMLSLSPRSVIPHEQLSKLLGMFQPEIRKQALRLDFEIDDSYHELKLDFVMADLVRVGQVLINLVSNAIKFTAKKEGEKRISVSMGASVTRPTSYPPDVVHFDPEDEDYRRDSTVTSEWGNGEVVYIMVAVRDTGIGINNEGQKRLFERFRQATPKTEEIYGGSGLGLNISRKLCHLHGGEIGVSSEDGVGSVFGFFFKVRRSIKPLKNRTQADTDVEDDKRRSQIKSRSNRESRPVEPGDAGDDASVSTSTDVQIPPCVAATEDGDDISTEDANPKPPLISRMSEHSRVSEYSREDAYSASDELGAYKERLTESLLSMPSPSPLLQEIGFFTGRDSRSSNSTDTGNEDPPGAGLHVLLVEDNIINQRILNRKLGSKGFTVTTANNGLEAVNETRKQAEAATRSPIFDCILMDQEMPVMDGNAASKAIRDLENEGVVSGHIPILGVTANVRGEQRVDMMAAGMDDVIHKPYKINDIVAKILDLIARHAADQD